MAFPVGGNRRDQQPSTTDDRLSFGTNLIQVIINNKKADVYQLLGTRARRDRYPCSHNSKDRP
jgi:hypothetical protein